MRRPKVSVGFPVYNGARYLHKALDSILAQDFEDFELILCDNASTDETGSICADYARRDSRVRYFRNDHNIGLAPNHNRVFTLSQGEYFKWAAHDDEYPRQMLKRCVEILDTAPPSVSLVYTHCEFIDEFGNSKGTRTDHVEKRHARPHRRLGHLLRWVSVFNVCYGMIRSDVLRKTRLEGSFPFSDYVLMAELAMLGELWEIPEPLIRLRYHAGKSTLAHPTPQALRTWYDPLEAKKHFVLSLRQRADLEVVRSAVRLPLDPADRLLCILTALMIPYWRRFCTVAGPRKRRVSEILFRKVGTHTTNGTRGAPE